MYAMNIQNDVIGHVLRENCKSKQRTDFIAWPSRCHDTISEKHRQTNTKKKQKQKQKTNKQINKQIHFIANLFHLFLLLL